MKVNLGESLSEQPNLAASHLFSPLIQPSFINNIESLHPSPPFDIPLIFDPNQALSPQHQLRHFHPAWYHVFIPNGIQDVVLSSTGLRQLPQHSY